MDLTDWLLIALLVFGCGLLAAHMTRSPSRDEASAHRSSPVPPSPSARSRVARPIASWLLFSAAIGLASALTGMGRNLIAAVAITSLMLGITTATYLWLARSDFLRPTSMRLIAAVNVGAGVVLIIAWSASGVPFFGFVLGGSDILIAGVALYIARKLATLGPTPEH
ncbi:MAG TPA: hypothetical protein VI434_04905 [Candidatus Dormibacteraeota bacterium]